MNKENKKSKKIIFSKEIHKTHVKLVRPHFTKDIEYLIIFHRTSIIHEFKLFGSLI